MTADFPAAPSVEALETGDVLAPRFGPDGLIGLQRKVHASYDEFFRFRQA